MATEPCNSICFLFALWNNIQWHSQIMSATFSSYLRATRPRGAKHLILASDVTNIRPPPTPSTPPPSSSSSTSSPSSSPPLNGKNRWVVFCGLPNWRFCNLKKRKFVSWLAHPHLYRAKKFSVPQSFAAGVLLALQILHHGSDLIENVTFTKSWPLPSEKESLNRSKSAQNWSSFSISLLPKVSLPSLNFDHISNLGFIFLFHSVFQDTFLATPSPSHPSPLSQREQSQQVKMCQTYEKTYTRQKLKRKRREKPWNLRNPGQNRSATLDQAVSNIIIRIPGQFLKLVKIVKDKSCS